MIFQPKDLEYNSKPIELVKKYIENKITFELIKKHQKKSVDNNAYLHVCINLFAINFGYTKEEAKTHLKRSCSFMVYQKNNELFLKEVRKLNNKDCASFTNWIRNYASNKGCYIPTPKEYYLNKYNIDKEINNNKEFL